MNQVARRFPGHSHEAFDPVAKAKRLTRQIEALGFELSRALSLARGHRITPRVR
jgi:hypothetical protein